MRRPRLPLKPVRQQIWAQACELVIAGHAREISQTLANRFHVSERAVDAILVLEGLRHERTAATLKTGVLSALEESRIAASSVDEEVQEVA